MIKSQFSISTRIKVNLSLILIFFFFPFIQAGDGVKKKAKKARTSKNSSGANKKRGVKEEAPIVGEKVRSVLFFLFFSCSLCYSPWHFSFFRESNRVHLFSSRKGHRSASGGGDDVDVDGGVDGGAVPQIYWHGIAPLAFRHT